MKKPIHDARDVDASAHTIEDLAEHDYASDDHYDGEVPDEVARDNLHSWMSASVDALGIISGMGLTVALNRYREGWRAAHVAEYNLDSDEGN